MADRENRTNLRQVRSWPCAQKARIASLNVNHPIEVARLVASVGAAADAICAALLHDAIEDQDITAAHITREFGADVTALVCEVTEKQASKVTVHRVAFHRSKTPR
jgi:(p)ppGpp synthase/HD superfamily hydrolase